MAYGKSKGMDSRTAEAMAAQVIANAKRNMFLNDKYPVTESNFSKQAMDNRILLGRGKALPAPKKGKVQLGGKII